MPADEPTIQGPSPRVSALLYCAALIAGVTLVILGHVSPIEASGFISPFLVIFEGTKPRK